MSESLASTPLDAWHRAAGAKMLPFAGYEMPIVYSSIVAEHHACRNAAAVFDVSHMGRLKFEGDGSEDLLDHLLSRRVSDMPLGRVRYGLICNEEGGVLDDVLVSNLETPSQKRFHLMVVNASNRQKIIDWITPRMADFPTVTMSDRTDLTAMIAVQGPKAMDICGRLFKSDPSKLKYFQSRITDQMGKPVIISRTGYTGEDGFELVVRAEEANRVWENLMLIGRDEGFIAAGLVLATRFAWRRRCRCTVTNSMRPSIRSPPACRSRAIARTAVSSAGTRSRRWPPMAPVGFASGCCPRVNVRPATAPTFYCRTDKRSARSPAVAHPPRWVDRLRWRTSMRNMLTLKRTRSTFAASFAAPLVPHCRFTNAAFDSR